MNYVIGHNHLWYFVVIYEDANSPRFLMKNLSRSIVTGYVDKNAYYYKTARDAIRHLKMYKSNLIEINNVLWMRMAAEGTKHYIEK